MSENIDQKELDDLKVVVTKALNNIPDRQESDNLLKDYIDTFLLDRSSKPYDQKDEESRKAITAIMILFPNIQNVKEIHPFSKKLVMVILTISALLSQIFNDDEVAVQVQEETGVKIGYWGFICNFLVKLRDTGLTTSQLEILCEDLDLDQFMVDLMFSQDSTENVRKLYNDKIN